MVRKILFVFILFFSLALLLPGNALATPKGFVNCSEVRYICNPWWLETCEHGCGPEYYECGENCPYTPPAPPACPHWSSCGSVNCDTCTQVCCYTGCKPIAEGCGGGGNDPKGWHDGSNCTNSGGWTCDADNYSTALTVKFYTDSNRTNYVGETTANQTREQAVANNCGGYANHGFGFTTPDSLKDGASHNIYAYAINTGGGSNKFLSGTPKTITCASLPPSCVIKGDSSVTTQDITKYSISSSANAKSTEIWKSPTGSESWTNICSSSGNCSDYIQFASPGTYWVVCNAYSGAIGSSPKCSGNPFGLPSGWSDCGSSSRMQVTVTPPGPWWQVKDGDVQTNGDLNLDVPTGLYFDLPGLGGFPGVAKYGGSTTLTSGNVSVKGWLAKSSYSPPNGVQNYTYFRRMIPEDVTLNPISLFPSGGTASNGYYWYEYDGSVTGLPFRIISSVNLPPGRKVVLLVTGADLNIEGSINYTSGRSIFVALVNGNINIDPTVGGAADPNFDLMGFFLADSNISTGDSLKSLRLKGSVVALGSLVLQSQRDLGGSLNTNPSEFFEYDPASAFLFPPKLSAEKTRWKEVAP